MSHSHPIICCLRILREIKVTISHLLFNTPSLSACCGPSLPLCPTTLSPSDSPPSILSSFSLSLSLSLRPILCLMNRPSASVSLSHPSGCPPSVSQTHTHAHTACMWIFLSDHPHTLQNTQTWADTALIWILNVLASWLLNLLACHPCYRYIPSEIWYFDIDIFQDWMSVWMKEAWALLLKGTVNPYYRKKNSTYLWLPFKWWKHHVSQMTDCHLQIANKLFESLIRLLNCCVWVARMLFVLI